jgi:hypothetical protein
MDNVEITQALNSLGADVRDLKTMLQHPTIGIVAQYERRITALEICVRDLEIASARGAALGGGVGAGATGLVLVFGKAMGWW